MSSSVHTTKKTNEAGFSLVELMISAVVFLIFMSAVYGLLRMGNIQKTTGNTQTEIIKNIRLSLNTIGRDAVNAGLGYTRVGGYVPDNLTNIRMNLPADPNSSQDLITSVIAGNQINTNSLLPGDKTDVISFAFRDLTFNAGEPIELSGVSNNGGSGIRLTTTANGTVNSRPFDLYLISDGARTALGLVTSVPNGNTLVLATGAADPIGVNAPFTGSTDVRSNVVDMNFPVVPGTKSLVTAKKVFWVSYQVTSDGTLTRTSFANNTGAAANAQIQVQPIAYNIQNFQVRYLLNDGTVSDDPSNNGLNQNLLNQVVQIEATITSRIQIYENGTNINDVIYLKSTFSTKNLSYDIG